MRKAFAVLSLLLLTVLSPPGAGAASYRDGLAPPGVPAGAFPAPHRQVAGIVTDTWRDEQSRDRAGEAERVMRLLGVKPGLDVADIGAGSGYYHDLSMSAGKNPFQPRAEIAPLRAPAGAITATLRRSA
jgi:hypothetical protein